MRSLRSIYVIIALLAIALYAVTLGGTFIYDDVAVVQQDRRLADSRDWGQYWTDSYNFGVDNLYRPMVSMTYAVQHRLHGDKAWPYHLVNVLLHAIASVLVAWVATRLLEGVCSQRVGANAEVTERRSRTSALHVGLLFAAHPVHVEAVANIVGRAELMCAIATLAAIGLAVGPLTMQRVIAIWLCCASAILCKEQGLLAPIMVGVVRYSSRRFAGRQSLPLAVSVSTDEASRRGGVQTGSLDALLFALLLASVAAIVFVRENLIHLKFWWDRSFLDPWIQPLSDSVGADRWLAPFTICGRYLGLLIAPVTLRIDYGGPIVPGVVDAHDPYFWLGVAGLLIWLAILAIGIRKRDRTLVVLALLFAIAYAPVSNWPTIIGVNVAERLMYLPSVFFVILASVLLSRLPRRTCFVFVGIAVALFSLRTVTYANRWNDRLAFYEYAASVERRSMKAALLTMQEHADRGDLDAAERWARKAIAIEPTYQDAWLRLAGVLIDKGDLTGAQAAIEHARSILMNGKIGAYETRLEEKRHQ